MSRHTHGPTGPSAPNPVNNKHALVRTMRVDPKTALMVTGMRSVRAHSYKPPTPVNQADHAALYRAQTKRQRRATHNLTLESKRRGAQL